jgi:hypothetical protein
MPSLDDNDGRTCVVNDAAMLTDNQQQQKNEDALSDGLRRPSNSRANLLDQPKRRVDGE